MTEIRGIVCIATSVHKLCDARIFYREAQTLVRAGYRVRLIGPGPAPDPIDGLTVVEIRRQETRVRRFLLTGVPLFVDLIRTHADIYHLHDPELLWIGLILRAIGRSVIYDAHEDLPEQILSKSWIPRPLRRLAAWLVRRWLRLGLRRLDGVVATADCVADALHLPTRPIVVRNYPVLDLIETSAEWKDGAQIRVIYLGQVTEERGAVEMIEAMRLLAEPRIELILMGPMSESVSAALRRCEASVSVTAIPWQRPLDAYKILASAHIGLACLRPLPRFQDALPVKLFEYMAAGIPVVVSGFPLWREIVETAECGILVDPLDASAIADAVRGLVDRPEERLRMGKNGRRAAEERYNWRHEAPQLLDLYRRVLRERNPARRA